MKEKSTAISAEQLPGHYYRPDGMPYGSRVATVKMQKRLDKEGIVTEAVQVSPNNWALKEVGRHSIAESSTAGVGQQKEETSQEAVVEKVSGKSAAVVEEQSPPAPSEDDEIARKRAELGKLNERIALEQDLVAARVKFASLKEGVQGVDKRESIRREGDPGGRKRRKGLARRNVLLFPEIPGMVTRVVNDTADGARVAAMIEDDWAIVQGKKSVKVESDGDVNRPSQDGSVVARHVGMDASGKSIRGVLMMLPKEIYDERIAEQQQEITEMELALSEPPAGLNRPFINVPGNPNLPAGLSVGEPESEANVKF